MELVDALCNYPSATSPVELSLSPLSRRTHTPLYKSLAETAWEKVLLAEVLGSFLPSRQPTFWVLEIDVTNLARQFGHRVTDRGFVYHSNLVTGNKAMTIGH